MPDEDFAFMREVLAAPSPVSLEAAMTMGVIKPWLKQFAPPSWEFHSFKGNGGLVVDTHPGRDDMLTVMVCGHADKIRMQVRHISSDGKIYINSDSFLPMTLIGNEIILFSESPDAPGSYRRVTGTVEALGAIHFSSAKARTGAAGIKPEQLYIELGIHGDKGREQVESLGIRPGDAVIMDRPITKTAAPNAFSGAYLDNGLGCYVAAQLGRMVAQGEASGGGSGSSLQEVRCLFAFAAHEEIGRFGSRVLAAQYAPDVLIAVDVNHDYKAAPNVGHERFVPLEMGKGFSTCHGAISSEYLNGFIEEAAKANGIPYQRDMRGRDTGTDAMASVLGGVDSAATSLGFPIRNMHTISELGHTGDVIACIHALKAALDKMEAEGVTAEDLKESHPRLDQATVLPVPADLCSSSSKKE
jgi:endoglucanase